MTNHPDHSPLNFSHPFHTILEWDRFIELAQLEAFTQPGKSLIENLKDPMHWAQDIESAQVMQQETQQISSLLDRDALWGPLLNLPHLEKTMDRLSRDTVLEMDEFANIQRWLYAIESWNQIPREEIRGEKLKKSLSSLTDPLRPLKLLEEVLTPEGALSENASPRIAALFHEMRSLKKAVMHQLDHLLKKGLQKGFLQEDFSDFRDGKYVLPVKIGFHKELEGIIHETSASRQTVFIEPKEVSLLNHQLKQKENELLQEIYILQKNLSKKLQPHQAEMKNSILTLIHWDVVQAKARLGRHFSGKSIQLTEDRFFSLNQTAHPLLWWSLSPSSIIRNDIEFGKTTSGLLMTGPNTGGKTVLLKTLGLAGLCAKTGFKFPASDHPIVPFFDSFFADLGDPQSIENHLSSFSGHVLKFKEILEKMTEKSLILMDELNSATDPEEGSAFGRAILETILSRGAMLVATTHDPHLKALALSDSRLLNACMTFDETSRTPTFQVLMGVPGRSRALETAERLGIPTAIIQLARQYLSREHSEFENLLKKLQTDTYEAAQAYKEALVLKQEAEELKKRWTKKTDTFLKELLDKTRQKLKRSLEQAQDEIRLSVRQLDEVKTRKGLDQTRSELNKTFSQTTEKFKSVFEEETREFNQDLEKESPHRREGSVQEAPPTHPSVKCSLLAGSTVSIPKWKNRGTVLELKGDTVKVAMGNLMMSLRLSEVEPIVTGSSKKGGVQFQVESHPNPRSQENGLNSLDLRGMRVEEAMQALEKHLDLTFRTKQNKEISIIHGLGTGALRIATLQLVKRLPYIKSYRDGNSYQGGTGVTIIELDF